MTAPVPVKDANPEYIKGSVDGKYAPSGAPASEGSVGPDPKKDKGSDYLAWLNGPGGTATQVKILRIYQTNPTSAGERDAKAEFERALKAVGWNAPDKLDAEWGRFKLHNPQAKWPGDGGGSGGGGDVTPTPPTPPAPAPAPAPSPTPDSGGQGSSSKSGGGSQTVTPPKQPEAPAKTGPALPISKNPSVSPDDKEKFHYKDNMDGKAFIRGANDANKASDEDINQGYLGDCYLMAGMAATAQADPKAIENLVKDNGDGTYNVTLYDHGKQQTVRVDSALPSQANGSPSYAGYGSTDKEGHHELWPALIEKAYTVMNGKKGKQSYADIEGGLPGNAVEALINKKPLHYRPSNYGDEEVVTMVEAALVQHIPVSCATLGDADVTPALKKLFKQYNAYADHSYTFKSVDVGSKMLQLRNPWGIEHPKPMPVSVFKQLYDILDINTTATGG